ncbi:MAG: type VI secretion system tip protein VgrG [Pricia sp.]|nr:type VI secretion system tip protein VgrG [Pricia sp.]
MAEKQRISTSRTSDLVTFTLLSEGTVLPTTISVQSIVVWQEVNRIPRARLIILDGSAADQTFAISEEDYFVPGKEIEIQVGYHSDEECIFKGIVTKHGIKVRSTGKSHLIVDCAHPAVKMTKIRKSRYFYDSKESDAWSQIIEEFGFSSNIHSTDFEHKELLQFEATDWDYIVTRAETNGLFVIGEKDTLDIQPPDFDQDATEAVSFGSTLLSFDAEIDAASQVSTVKGHTWDYSKTEITEIEAADQNPVTPGNLDFETLSQVYTDTELIVRSNAKQSDEVLQQWADATLLRHQLAKVRGRAQFQGIPKMKAGKIIELQGLGDRFNGKAFVSGVKHEITKGDWHIDVQFGLDSAPFADQFEIGTLPAAGIQPALNGLQIGIVTQIEGDPDSDERLLVNVPLMKSDDRGVWARMATGGAGDGRGVIIRPEIGDEVVLGFVNDDPHSPVILGSLNSSNLPAPIAGTDDNHEKGWITRGGIELMINDDEKSVLVKLPSGKELVLSDDADEISLKDDHQNAILMNSDGITLESGKDIILKTSAGDIKMEGINVQATAQAEAKIEASGMAELSSSGSTTVKGSIVQIN